MPAKAAGKGAAVQRVSTNASTQIAKKNKAQSVISDKEIERMNRMIEGDQKQQQEMGKQELEKWKEIAQVGDSEALFHLGECYAHGKGVKNDKEIARFYFEKSAKAGYAPAMYTLAGMESNEQAAAACYYVAGLMFAKQGDEEGLQGAWDACMALTGMGADEYAAQLYVLLTGEEQSAVQYVSMGTGWLCEGGYIVTCYHVVSEYTNITVKSQYVAETPVRVVAADPENDLVLLKADGDRSPGTELPLAASTPKLGQKVHTYGFPHIDVMGKSLKYTDGAISSLQGMEDDPRHFQISVAIQSGNSGGPLLNENEEVVGVVASKLRTDIMIQATGDFTQNVNYAVKVKYLRALLDSVNPSERTNVSTSQRAVAGASVERSVVIVLAH